MCAWLRRNRDALDHTGGVGVIEGPEIVQIVAALEADKACVEDLGALGHAWPRPRRLARRAVDGADGVDLVVRAGPRGLARFCG